MIYETETFIIIIYLKKKKNNFTCKYLDSFIYNQIELK